tara:strand:- start:630 stop:1010 length:381 start_codon:yes stop_codon:yes gene_type:complete
MTKLKLKAVNAKAKKYSNNSTINDLAKDIVNDFTKECTRVMYKPDYEYDYFNTCISLRLYMDETKKITRSSVLESFKQSLINEIKTLSPGIFDITDPDRPNSKSELMDMLDSMFEIYQDRFCTTVV